MQKKTKWIIILGVAAIGGLLGYLYYVYVGCLDGSCPIKSNPWKMTAWCAAIGGLLASIVLPDGEKKKD